MKKLILCLITGVACLVSGCSTLIKYSPVNTNNVEQAKRDIEFALYSQLNDKCPTNVSVTDRFVGIGGIVYKRHMMSPNLAQTTSHGKESRIYYRSMGLVELYQMRDYFPVFVYDVDGYVIYRGYFKSEPTAKLFIDSLYTLKENFKKNL